MRSPNQSSACDWSPDERFLVYTVADPKTKRDLWLLPLSGDRKPVPFLQTPSNEGFGRISPEGTWIAYQSDESGQPEVYVTSFPTPGRKGQVSTNGGMRPYWRGDGKELFYIEPQRKLMSVAVNAAKGFDAGVPKELFQMSSGVYLPARDGQRFLVNVEVQKAVPQPIQVAINWAGGLKQR